MATKMQVITNVTDQNQLSNEDKTFYERALLERLLPQLQFYKDARKRKLAKNEGRTVNFRRFDSLTIPASNGVLTEGVTPDGNDLTVSVITATVEQYGDWVSISDLIQMTGIDPVITETSQLLGEEASEVFDSVIQSKLKTGTNVFYAGGKASEAALASDATITKLTGDDVKKIVRKLKNANAKRFPDGYYHMIINPSVAFDLMSDSAWVDVTKYCQPGKLEKGELGKMHGMKFYETTNLDEVKVTSYDSNPLVVCYAYGSNSYDVIDLEGGAGKPSIIVKPNGSAGSADPLNQRASVGYKAAFTAVITQPLALVKVETPYTK